MEITPCGTSHVRLKNVLDGNGNRVLEHYTWNKVTTCVHNIIVGKLWIDHYGEMVVKNHTTGDVCTLTFKAAGWRGPASQIRGKLVNKQGLQLWDIGGKWTEKLAARRFEASAADDNFADNVSTGTRNSSSSQVILLWKRAEIPAVQLPYNLTNFAVTLNEINPKLAKIICPTDSRLRPDQKALEFGDFDLADSEKRRLEEKQRK